MTVYKYIFQAIVYALEYPLFFILKISFTKRFQMVEYFILSCGRMLKCDDNPFSDLFRFSQH